MQYAPWGGQLRGIESASHYWFGTANADLSLDQCAALVAMLPAPSRRRATSQNGQEELFAARNRVIERLDQRHCDYHNQPELNQLIPPAAQLNALSIDHLDHSRRLARQQPLNMQPHQWPWHAPHLVDWLLHSQGQLTTSYHSHQHTNQRPHKQQNQQNIQQRSQHADLSLYQDIHDLVNAESLTTDGCSVVVAQRGSGHIVSMLGSTDWWQQPFNAATARRSSGSTLKPFIYSLAEQNQLIHYDSVINDAPLRMQQYQPRNFDQRYAGRLSARESLALSRNTTAVALLNQIGADRFQQLLTELSLVQQPHITDINDTREQQYDWTPR